MSRRMLASFLPAWSAVCIVAIRQPLTGQRLKAGSRPVSNDCGELRPISFILGFTGVGSLRSMAGTLVREDHRTSKETW